MANGKVYSLKSVVLVLGGIPIAGGFTDDAVGLEPNGDLFDEANGADGNTVWNETLIDTWTLTISVSETSPLVPVLDGIVSAALIAVKIPGVPALLPGTLIDSLSGETTAWASGIPARRPNRGKGATAGTRSYVFRIKDPIFGTAALNAVR